MTISNRISRRRLITSAVSAAAIALPNGRLKADGEKHKIKGDEMTTLTPYLLFDGHCHQAMDFYQSCFGGELNVIKVKDSPVKDHMPAIQQDKVLNARLRHGNLEISASDWLRPDRTPVRGNTVCLYLRGGTLRELQTLFEKLSDGADVTDPLQPVFFGSYGALNDKFGVRWMFQSDEKAAA